MEKTAEFLAEEILVEKKIVTYRYLSRALKLHVNAAKRALFEFHKSQNAKKPGFLHATYLIYGVKAAEEPSHSQHVHKNEEDVDMEGHHSEDEMLSDPFPTLSLALVAEEALEETLSKYESLESIHVYSLSVQPMTDLQLLADSPRQLRELVQSKGLEESPKTYGTICNPHVKRRQRKAAPVPTPAHRPAAKPAAKPAAAQKDAPGPNSIWNKAKKTSTTAETKAKPETLPEDKKPGPNSIWNKIPKQKDGEKATKAETAEATKPAALPEAKKSSGGGGGIMQAFAKGAAAAKPKKAQPKATITAPDSDAAMALSDDGGDDDDTELFPKPHAVAGGKSRKEREEELLKMMEEDDDEKSASEEEREDSPMEDVQETPAEPEPPKKEEASEIVTTSGDGRRRGKRRIMRKKMIEDENGYLVTIQEPGWESFSEDEAPAAKPQPVKPTHSNTAQAPKAKKQAGQGSIMSFFAKK